MFLALHHVDIPEWVTDAVAVFGLVVVVALLVLGLFRWHCCRQNGFDPERPIYLLLALSAVPGISWFLALLFHIVDPGNDLWILWSRMVISTPYFVMLIVVAIRLQRRFELRRKAKRRG